MKKLKTPLLLIAALIIALIMLRLGVWQLDRAEQKRQIFVDQQAKVTQPALDLRDLIESLLASDASALRFTPIIVKGRYLAKKSIYLDNQVVGGQVGYKVFTPFELDGSDWSVLVNRGWLPVGESRKQLPGLKTSSQTLELTGRLNLPPPPPPMWNDKYPVASGKVWQFLPIEQYQAQMQLMVLPLVVELAPEYVGEVESALIRRWAQIDDQWVAKHQAYALQWFAMAIAFLIACAVLLLKVSQSHKHQR
jgi:surfeit locus 1 family protein